MRTISEIEKDIKFVEGERDGALRELKVYRGEDTGVERVIDRRDRANTKLEKLENELLEAKENVSENSIVKLTAEYDNRVAERNQITGGITDAQISELEVATQEAYRTLNEKKADIKSLKHSVSDYGESEEGELPKRAIKENEEAIAQFEILTKQLDEDNTLYFERPLTPQKKYDNIYVATLVGKEKMMLSDNTYKVTKAQAYLDEETCKKFIDSENPELIKQIFEASEEFMDSSNLVFARRTGASRKPSQALDDSLSELMGEDMHVRQDDDFAAQGKFSPKTNYSSKDRPVMAKKIIDNEKYAETIKKREAEGIDEEAYETELSGLREQEEGLDAKIKTDNEALNSLREQQNHIKKAYGDKIEQLNKIISELEKEIKTNQDILEKHANSKSKTTDGLAGLSNAVKSKEAVEDYDRENTGASKGKEGQTSHIK